jgi:predicted ribosome quality control (RQC) complex YloA/Tae2 family protein
MQATRPREVNKTSSKRTKVSGPLIRISSDGLEIWVGRNARENETVTFRWAKGNDWWLHAQGVGGAHVVIRNFGGDLPTRTLEEAAQLATYFSKLRKAGRAEVDYTRRKHVRRVRGGPAGLVHFSQNRTLPVRLNSELVNRLLARTTV